MYNEIARQLRQPKGILGRILSKFLKRMNAEIYIEMVKRINAQDGDKIYEIGYGHGSGVFQIANQAVCEIDGIDFSEVMYTDAIKLNRKFIKENRVDLTYGDFLDADLKSEYYDKLFCVNVIYFWSNLELPFLKIREALNSEGIFYIYMDSLDEIKNSPFTNEEMFNHYTVEYVVEELEKLGFQTSINEIGRGYIISSAKKL